MELLKIENSDAFLSVEISREIADFERQIKILKDKEDKLKTAILAEMEAKGIVKVENEHLIINYIASTDREQFDSKAFQKEHPIVYDRYVRMIPVKPSIRIKVK